MRKKILLGVLFISVLGFTACSSNSSSNDEANKKQVEEETPTPTPTEAPKEISESQAKSEATDYWNMAARMGLMDMKLAKKAGCNSIRGLNAASISLKSKGAFSYCFVVKGSFSAYDDYGNFVSSYNFEQYYDVDLDDGNVKEKNLNVSKH